MGTGQTSQGGIRWRASLVGLVLLILVVLTFGRSLRNGFVFDEHRLVERNPVTRTLNPLTHLGSPFWARWEKAEQYYRPLTSWALALDRAIYGNAPWAYRLTNLWIHAASAWLLFLLVRRLAPPGDGNPN